MDDGAQEKLKPAVRKGPWTLEEDLLLVNYIHAHGEGAWDILACAAGLKRTGKSCRLRWLNYLSPNVRRGSITSEEHDLIVQLQAAWGNRWSKIARHLPGRTDNEIKNYWRTRIQKKQRNQDCMATNKSTSTEDQGSSSSSSGSGPEQVTQDYAIVVPQPGIRSLDPQAHGGGRGQGSCDGAMDVPPGFLSLTGENFWPFEDFWPMVKSFHHHSSAQFLKHEPV
ncbi:hypothetical protein EJB05_05855 [Eragrostis curvula]|uniref:Uncharacterized protein n=1 Tax=Eragrostis curvula TaxID=38414 RepID=A0A5J9WD87_9POAL|nr:hypothetical protein EJB05_05855 [Eragrostis curvula]